MTKRRPPKKSHRVHNHAEAFTETPRVISSEEKRMLIRAHAASRAPRDSVAQLTLWSGVLIAIAALVLGWWGTVGFSVRQSVEGSGSEDVRSLTTELQEFQKAATNNPVIKDSDLTGVTNQAAAGMAEFIESVLTESASSSNRRTDLLAPEPTSTDRAVANSEETEERTNPLFIVDPHAPGLEPTEL